MQKEITNKINKDILDLKVKSQVLVDEPAKFLSVKRYECTLNNGDKMMREKLFKNGKEGNSVIILARTNTQKFLLNVEPKPFCEQGFTFNFPAGYIENSETPERAGERELKEETGYTASTFEIIKSYYQDLGVSSAINYIVFADNVKKVQNQHLDKDEYVHFYEFTFLEIQELLNMKYICEAPQILAFMKLEEFLKNCKR